MAEEWKYAVVTGNSVTVESVPCIVGGVYINIPPSSDAKIEDGDNRPFLIPAGTAVGNCFGFDGTRLETNMVISAGGGDITVMYWIMGEAHK